MRRAYALGLLAGLAAGCGGGSGEPPDDGGGLQPRILEIRGPEPVVEGSRLQVSGSGLDALGASPVLRIEKPMHAPVELPAVGSEQQSEREFEVTAELVTRLGDGSHEVDVVAAGAGRRTPPKPHRLAVAGALTPALDEVPSGEVHRNDRALLRGGQLLSRTEGSLRAHFEGDFTVRDGGEMRPVDVALPVTLAERFSRDRGLVVLTTDIGGVEPGTFDGTITLEWELLSGGGGRGEPHETTLAFGPPVLFGAEPTTFSLEQIITVRGAGFLGGPERPDEATLVELEGTFTPQGDAPGPFGPAELVPAYVAGDTLEGVIQAEARSGRLISSLFRFPEGQFEGRATPVVIDGTTEVRGDPIPATLTLAPVQQVVWVRFLPGFYDSLPRFGLATAAGVVEERVVERIASIYSGWRVDVRLEEPTDFSDNGYATLEIGGPDPNDLGLFGYDNTPGKDVGNLRLYDSIGGENADTQADGAPGYGGVFVENFLFFSSHPEVSGGTPPGAPPSDALFDEIFDPVREQAATLAEIRGESGDAERDEAVERALDAFAKMVGETAAHELGHSLGLADPFGPPDSFHNPSDSEGCLMDGGANRPFGERAGEPGYAEPHLCHDGPMYMDEILGG